MASHIVYIAVLQDLKPTADIRLHLTMGAALYMLKNGTIGFVRLGMFDNSSK